jgi:hypothetical protein
MKYSVRICYRLYYFNDYSKALSFANYWGVEVTDEEEYKRKLEGWYAYPKPTHSSYHERAEKAHWIQHNLK